MSQVAEVALDSARPADHDVIGADVPTDRNDLPREFAEAPLHAVAHDCTADLLGDGETYTLRRIAVVAVTNEKDEAGRRRAPSGVRSEEIRALAEDI